MQTIIYKEKNLIVVNYSLAKPQFDEYLEYNYVNKYKTNLRVTIIILECLEHFV